MTSTHPYPSIWSVAVAALAAAGVATADDSLTLRAHDAIAPPGGVAAIVLRTYAPRPVGVGQVCLRPLGPSTFAGLEGQEVFSEAADALSRGELESTPDGQQLLVRFTSPSGTINALDGPLGVVYLRLDPALQVGDTVPIVVDPAATVLFEPDGDPIPIEPRDGELTVRAPSDPYLLAVEGDDVAPGETADLEVETYEPFGVGQGRLVITFAPELAAGPPRVTLDPRHGEASFAVDTSRPGRIVIDVASPEADYNSAVPGGVVRIELPTSPSIVPGQIFPVRMHRARSWLLDGSGERLLVAFADGAVTVE